MAAIIRFDLDVSKMTVQGGCCTTVVVQNHWVGAYRTNALYSGHIFVRFNDLEDVLT